MRATLEWRVAQLGQSDRDLLAQLGTFIGGATFDAIEKVCQ